MKLRALIVVLMVAAAGCASPDRAPDLPPVVISESTWQQVDRDIATASLAATGAVENFARGAMESWRERVNQRTEADFIPWFTSYWTQRWLAIKVAWYKVSAGEESDATVKRLATYLQEQYHDRVLEPVAKEIDPSVIMAQATKLYVQLLGEQLQGIPQHYDIPVDQFDRRLKDIPAITLAPPPTHSASLYQIVHADPLAKLPAHVAMLDRIRNAAGGAGAESADSGISSVAKRASEKLEDQLATNSVASAVGTAAGRVASVVISMGVAAFGAIAHENERPEMEARLRENLNAALTDEWLRLMENPATGVMAGVHYLSGQIEGSLANTVTLPVKFEPAP